MSNPTRDPRDDRLREVQEDARAVVTDALRKAEGALKAGAAMRSAWELAQAVVDELRTPRKQLPVCKPSCAWCCRGGNVEVLPAEALVIAAHLRGTRSELELGRVRQRIESDATDVRSRTVAQRFFSQVPCPLLDEERGHCTAYEVRPMPCRGYHSLDAAECERACREPKRERQNIPMNAPRYFASRSLADGLVQAFVEAGLDARPLPIATALESALNDASAAERWSRGERVFDAALRPLPLVEAQAAEDSRRARNAKKRARRNRA